MIYWFIIRAGPHQTSRLHTVISLVTSQLTVVMALMIDIRRACRGGYPTPGDWPVIMNLRRYYENSYKPFNLVSDNWDISNQYTQVAA